LTASRPNVAAETTDVVKSGVVISSYHCMASRWLCSWQDGSGECLHEAQPAWGAWAAGVCPRIVPVAL